ncbi:ABC transporter substrate-binding protein [Moraxella marmotae]|uniref:ABC transporter substrate-binding protein n=1 Tax=Moraxella marmotae TaxID=3344520 RepID=UPI0035F38A45
MKKLIPVVVIVGIIALIVALINRPNPHQQTATQNTSDGDDKQTLTVVTPWELTSTDPSTSGFIYQRLGIAETLVDVDEQGKLIPALASDWHSDDHGKTWYFRLRDGVKFHDGSTLDSDAVVNALTIALGKPTALESAHIQAINATDASTVQFVLQSPLQAFPAYLAHATAIILSPKAYDAKGEVAQVIGTGAYQATLIEPPQKVEQVAFDGYWGQKAHIKHITYLANSRSESRTLLAQSSPNHLVYNLDAASLARLQADDNLQVHTKSIARTIQYKVNAKAAPFDDVKVRQILSQAIDRQGISESILQINGGMAEQILPPLFADWQLDLPHKKPDYDALKQALFELGFSQNAEGKLLDSHGKPVKFTLKTFSDRPELPLVATALQAQFAKLGIDVDVAIGNFSDIPASHQNGTLQMALYARNYGLIPDPIGTLMEDFDAKGSDWGVMNWQNPTLTTLLTQLNDGKGGESNDIATKKQISQIIHDEQPITPIVYYQQQVVANKKLSGVTLDPFERHFHLNQLSW